MKLGPGGLPTGIDPARSRLMAAPTLIGELVRLNDGVSLSRIVVEGIPGQGANVVVLGSTAPGSSASATIEDCEIINPNPSSGNRDGPIGRSMLVWTLPEIHPNSKLELTVRTSLLKGQGNALFAVNFSAQCNINIDLERCVMGGGLNASGGASRPNPVTQSSTLIHSHKNEYRSFDQWPIEFAAWNLNGGSNSPLPDSKGTAENFLRIESRDDSLHGFNLGIYAAGGARGSANGDPVNGNRLEIDLQNTTLSSNQADMSVVAALTGNANLTPGDNNHLDLTVQHVTGSARPCGYHDAALQDGTPLAPAVAGTGNRLRIAGTPQTFAQQTNGITPVPGADFFD
jgi:hypothetical protein